MTNIPTELLRTFVAVVDLRSFTRAAQSLGITQPAVSAQVKRLQTLLGGELMDKSAPGVLLTAMGESVLASARRLLAINDQILAAATTRAADAHTIRVGVPGDFVCGRLWRTLVRSRDAWPGTRFHVKSGPSEGLARDVHQGDLDVALLVSGPDPFDGARTHWHEPLVWVRGRSTTVHTEAPVPLVGHGDKCFIHRQVAETLSRAGRAYEVIFTETSTTGLAAAVDAGLGIMALPRCVLQGAGLAIWDDAPLPALPSVVCSVCVRTGAEEVADALALALADAFSDGQTRRSRPRADSAAE